MTYYIAAILFFVNVFAYASPTPCEFWALTADSKSTSYDIGRAYVAAEIVVIGSAKNFVSNQPQKVRIVQTIKGSPKEEIYLEGIHESGTDPWGAAISTDGEYLMLLKGGPKYSWIDRGSGCPNAFKVSSNKVTIGKTQIDVKNLKSYFESHPKPPSDN